MNISEIAGKTGLSAKTIRDYEKAGLLHPVRRTNGYRDYNQGDTDTLLFIRHTREAGFTLAETARLLELRNNPERTGADVKAIAGRHLALLDEKIARLQAARNTLAESYNLCAGSDSPDCPILDSLDGKTFCEVPHCRQKAS